MDYPEIDKKVKDKMYREFEPDDNSEAAVTFRKADNEEFKKLGLGEESIHLTWAAQLRVAKILTEHGELSVETIARATGRSTAGILRDFAYRGLKPPVSDMAEPDAAKWRELFHNYEEFEKAPPVTFAIKGWLQEGGVTMFGGLPGHGKTWLGLSTAKALLTQAPLFGHEFFQVPSKPKRVLYLCPEVSLGPLTYRMKIFGLGKFVQDDTFLFRTLSHKEAVVITDARILRAAEGADVFLDTAVRFMEGEENSASEQRVFSKNLFALLEAGARTVTGLHHAPKAFAEQEYMTLENALRGSSELGAMLTTAWGTKQVDEPSNRLYVQNLKARDFDAVGAFILEGRPWLDRIGDFRMIEAPGMAGAMRDHQRKGGQPFSIDPDLAAEIDRLHGLGMPVRDIAEKVRRAKSTISDYLVRGKGKRPVQGDKV